MADSQHNHLWKLLWDHDPNGLIVVDANLYIRLVNPAFCRMFKVDETDAIGQPVSVILEDIEDFRVSWEKEIVIRRAREYSQQNLFIKQVTFPIEDEGMIACTMVDFSHELEQQRELQKVKRETVRKVNEVVDNQMKVVQEIAGLLGETTAETKVSLLKIIQMLEQESL